MPEENSGQSISGAPAEETAVQPPVTSPGNQVPPSPPADRNPGQQGGNAQELEGIKEGEYWLIGIGIASVVLNALIAWIYYGQLTQMRMATEAAGKAAQFAADSYEIASGQFERTMQQSIPQTAAQIQSATAAGTAVKETQEQMRLDERAWIGVTDMVAGKEFSQKVGFPVVIFFSNSGKTPAQNVQFSLRYVIRDNPISEPPKDEIAKLEFAPQSSIPPQGKMSQIIGWQFPSGNPNTPAQQVGLSGILAHYQAIMDKKTTLYYFGILKYDDIFGKTRETEFCTFLADPDIKQFLYCRGFNDLH